MAEAEHDSVFHAFQAAAFERHRPITFAVDHFVQVFKPPSYAVAEQAYPAVPLASLRNTSTQQGQFGVIHGRLVSQEDAVLHGGISPAAV